MDSAIITVYYSGRRCVLKVYFRKLKERASHVHANLLELSSFLTLEEGKPTER